MYLPELKSVAVAPTVRQATIPDIPILTEIMQKSVRKLAIGHYTSRQMESALEHVFGIDSQLVDDGTYYVAEKDGKIVGCGGWSRQAKLLGGDQYVEQAPNGRVKETPYEARIRAFFVDPEFARQGIGSLLLSFSEKIAQQAGVIRLELVATLSGETLYRNAGFSATENLEMTLPDGVTLPVIKMGKSLTPTDCFKKENQKASALS